MSTMLATTNPAAVAEIEGNKDRRKPYEGQVVIFHMRPGEGRGGRMQAPAIVTRVEDDDHVELLVLFAADDFISRWKIPRRTEQNPYNSWAFNAHDESNYTPGPLPIVQLQPADDLNWDDVKQMYREIGELRASVATLLNSPANPEVREVMPPRSHDDLAMRVDNGPVQRPKKPKPHVVKNETD